MKKIIVIVTAVILVLILTYVFTVQNIEKSNIKIEKNIKKIENSDNQFLEVNDTSAHKTHISQEKISKKSESSNVMKPLHQHTSENICINAKQPIIKESKNTETATVLRKFTFEEEKLLQKIPRSTEVVVDKEIKVKSSKKYFFK